MRKSVSTAVKLKAGGQATCKEDWENTETLFRGSQGPSVSMVNMGKRIEWVGRMPRMKAEPVPVR